MSDKRVSVSDVARSDENQAIKNTELVNFKRSVSDSNNVSATLNMIHEVFALEQAWDRQHVASNVDKKSVSPTDPSAVMWSLNGVVDYAVCNLGFEPDPDWRRNERHVTMAHTRILLVNSVEELYPHRTIHYKDNLEYADQILDRFSWDDKVLYQDMMTAIDVTRHKNRERSFNLKERWHLMALSHYQSIEYKRR